jgi:hypothetical protein
MVTFSPCGLHLSQGKGRRDEMRRLARGGTQRGTRNERDHLGMTAQAARIGPFLSMAVRPGRESGPRRVLAHRHWSPSPRSETLGSRTMISASSSTAAARAMPPDSRSGRRNGYSQTKKLELDCLAAIRELLITYLIEYRPSGRLRASAHTELSRLPALDRPGVPRQWPRSQEPPVFCIRHTRRKCLSESALFGSRLQRRLCRRTGRESDRGTVLLNPGGRDKLLCLKWHGTVSKGSKGGH